MKKIFLFTALMISSWLSNPQKLADQNKMDTIDVREAYVKIKGKPGKHLLAKLGNGDQIMVDNSKTNNNLIVFTNPQGIPLSQQAAKRRVKIIASVYGKMCLECEDVIDLEGKTVEACIRIDCKNAKSIQSQSATFYFDHLDINRKPIDLSKLSNGVHKVALDMGYKADLTILNHELTKASFFTSKGKKLAAPLSSKKNNTCQECIIVADPNTSGRLGTKRVCFPVMCPDVSAEAINKGVSSQ